MKAIRTFSVAAYLPEELSPLRRIAQNLRWTWDARAIDLFRWVDADSWERSRHDPIRMLGTVSPERFRQLTTDSTFMATLKGVDDSLQAYLSEPRWYQEGGDPSGPSLVAYFSPEFGVSEALATYSGGLGVLAGDHLKAASDLGVPMVGVGLLYRQGYFRQELNSDGWQQERYPTLDPHAMPLQLATAAEGNPLRVEVDLAGVSCVAQVWRATVGRVPLLLLDCDVENNAAEERAVTDRLYAGGSEHRLRQEIVLGIGGVRALVAAGYAPDVFHSNEGHAGFLGLERIRRLATEQNLSFAAALEGVRAATIFTTHTPVAAGIDVYPRDLMERYFASFAKECGVSFDELFSLGTQADAAPPSEAQTFNMAVMGFRLAGRANGVSKLHREVSKTMFSSLWPQVPLDEVPITWVTNGVHTPTWLGPEMAEVLDRRFPPGWAAGGEVEWREIADVANSELWRARDKARERLVYFVRDRLRAQMAARGVSETEMAWTDEVFDPRILTIGFARRFAMYKRGSLMLTDPNRLRRLLSSEQPIQIVVAGKAHPLDDDGKEMIRRLLHFSNDPYVRGRFVFIEDYDMEVARVLTQGVDLWLNNPRRPLEACGTSGMKAALNGVLNCSTLDGWWDECYNGRNGWAIGTRDVYDDPDYQDRVDAEALYDLLEREITPAFYERAEGIPIRWVERMKASITSLGGVVTADRMLRDCIDRLYQPAARHGRELAENGFAGAHGIAAWKSRTRSGWGDVRVLNVDGEIGAAQLGEERLVAADVAFGGLAVDDVRVQLVHGLVGTAGEILNPQVIDMEPFQIGEASGRYQTRLKTSAAGTYGFSVRVIPSHPHLTTQMDLGLVTWA